MVILRLALTAFCLWPTVAAAEGKVPIGIFASLDARHPFWIAMRGFEEAGGKSLGLESRWRFAGSDQFLATHQIEEATQGADPIRGALITDFKSQGPRFLDLTASRHVPTITFVGFDLKALGQPRGRNPYWIGAMAVDEQNVGYQLATVLLKQAKRLGLAGPDGKLHVVAISGDPHSSLAKAREEGLRQAMTEWGGKAELDQMVSTDGWSQAEGRDKCTGLLRRFPAARVVWSANDAIALGVLEGARELGRKPNRDFVTGGIDWTPEALRKVASGDLVCSLGGLMFQAGWAALLMYDYLNGHDFKDDTGTVIHIPTSILTRVSATRYLKVFGGGWQALDLRHLSKTRTPGLKKYDFSLKSLLSTGPR
jgi:ABC-type sugar transport system substrate-binding protein